MNFKSSAIIACAASICLTAVLSNPILGAEPTSENPTVEETSRVPTDVLERAKSDLFQINRVLELFWNSMRKMDNNGIKTTLNWPCTLQEITPTEANSSFHFATAADFDRQMGNVKVEPGSDSGFSDLVISNRRVNILNQSMATVTYDCVIPARMKPAKRPVMPLSMVAIFRRDVPHKSWKIAYATIPQ